MMRSIINQGEEEPWREKDRGRWRKFKSAGRSVGDAFKESAEWGIGVSNWWLNGDCSPSPRSTEDVCNENAKKGDSGNLPQKGSSMLKAGICGVDVIYT
jgi:hypothetical protein